jgi:putative colanic acid biosynthesis acetyltransferase WcaF
MIDKFEVDASENRRIAKYPKPEMILRFFWMLAQPLFHYSPRTFFGWRRWLLRRFGATVGQEVHIYNSATIYLPWNLEIGDWSAIGEQAYIYNLGKIKIGHKTTISQRAHLCAGTHDYQDLCLPLLKPPIQIGDQVWVAADAFVGPGVTIGDGAIVGARAVVVKNVESWDIVVGNPAYVIKKRVLKHVKSTT